MPCRSFLGIVFSLVVFYMFRWLYQLDEKRSKVGLKASCAKPCATILKKMGVVSGFLVRKG